MSLASVDNARGKAVVVLSNPLEKRAPSHSAPAAGNGKKAPAKKPNPNDEEEEDEFAKKNLVFENLSEARQIGSNELAAFIKKYEQHAENNENAKIIDDLNVDKLPFLFTSDDMLKVMAVTTSVKTKLAIINVMSHRLVDPRAQMEHIMGLFRYADEKTAVEEALKARITVLNGQSFRTSSTTAAPVRPAGGRGRGAGRGDGFRPSRGQSTTSIETEDKKEDAPAAPRPAVNLRAAFGGGGGGLGLLSKLGKKPAAEEAKPPQAAEENN